MRGHYKKSLWIQTHKISSVHCGLTHTEGFCLKNDQNICSVMTSSYNTELKQRKTIVLEVNMFSCCKPQWEINEKLEEGLIAVKAYTFALC